MWNLKGGSLPFVVSNGKLGQVSIHFSGIFETKYFLTRMLTVRSCRDYVLDSVLSLVTKWIPWINPKWKKVMGRSWKAERSLLFIAATTKMVSTFLRTYVYFASCWIQWHFRPPLLVHFQINYSKCIKCTHVVHNIYTFLFGFSKLFACILRMWLLVVVFTGSRLWKLRSVTVIDLVESNGFHFTGWICI